MASATSRVTAYGEILGWPTDPLPVLVFVQGTVECGVVNVTVPYSQSRGCRFDLWPFYCHVPTLKMLFNS